MCYIHHAYWTGYTRQHGAMIKYTHLRNVSALKDLDHQVGIGDDLSDLCYIYKYANVLVLLHITLYICECTRRRVVVVGLAPPLPSQQQLL